jgi:DNA polymerase-3 subunit epsilon
VIHNATFDVGFLNAELKLLKHAQQSINDVCQVTDTLALARQLHIGQRNSLDALCKRYNVDHSHREYHGALLDAHLLARVYLAMTGGQATLFGQTETIESTTQQTTKTKAVSKKTHDLLVIKASDEELIEHEKRLKQMAEQGKCLWK